MTRIGDFLFRRNDGGTAVEFGILLPVLVALMVIVVEFVNIGYRYHQANEAVRRGARMAVIAAPIIDTQDLEGGATIVCKKAGGGVACAGGSVVDTASFDKVVMAMREMMPAVKDSEVEIEYRHSGFGSVDLPNGIFPLVTVRLKGHKLELSVGRVLPGMPTALTMPEMAVTQTGSGKKVGG